MVYLIKGGFWLILEQIVAYPLYFLLAIAFANLLSKETYGIYKYILSATALLAIPTLKGMDRPLTRAIAQGNEGSFIPVLKAKIRWGLLGSLISFGLAGYYYFNNNTVLATSFLIVAIFVPFMNSFAIYQSFLQGKSLFNILSRYKIISQIISVGCLVGTLFLTQNILLILLAYFVPWTLLRLLFLKLTVSKFPLNKKQDPETIDFGKHMSLIEIIGTVADVLDNILLWRFLGAAAVATYNFAITPVTYIRDFIKPVFELAFPKFAKKKVEEIKSGLGSKMLRFFFAVVPIAILYILLAPFIYKFLFPQYIEATFFSQIFVLVILFKPKDFIGTVIITQAQTKKIYFLSIATQITKIVLMLTLLPIYGILGAILAIIGTQAINAVLLVYLLQRI